MSKVSATQVAAGLLPDAFEGTQSVDSCMPTVEHFIPTDNYLGSQDIVISGLPPCEREELDNCQLLQIADQYRRLLTFGEPSQSWHEHARLMKEQRLAYTLNMPAAKSETQEKPHNKKTVTDDPQQNWYRSRLIERANARRPKEKVLLLPPQISFVLPITYTVHLRDNQLIIRVFCNPAEKPIERLASGELRALEAPEILTWLTRFCDMLQFDIEAFFDDTRREAEYLGIKPDYYGHAHNTATDDHTVKTYATSAECVQ